MASSQNAPLEKFLARQRRRRIQPYVEDKVVLDFGCGVNAWNSVAIQEMCRHVDGVDHSIPKNTHYQGIRLYNHLDQLTSQMYDVIIALAVFEHIRPLDLRKILRQFLAHTHTDSLIIGTIPSPRSRRLIEFLSFRLGLIDPSQVIDHKVYYDDLWLNEMVDGTGWQLKDYQTFQLGMNGFFQLGRSKVDDE